MGVPFRLEVAAPSTAISNAFTRVFTQSDQVVQSITVALKKEQGRSSYLTADLFDVDWAVFNALPDPAFFDVPVTLQVAPQDNPDAPPTTVFEGIITTLDADFPEPRLSIVAHDKSFRARVTATQRAIRGLTPLQAAQKIAGLYGWTVDADTGDAQLVARAVELGLPPAGMTGLTDWMLLGRILSSVGLTYHMKGKKLVIQQAPKSIVRTFRPGDGYLSKLNARIQHVRGPGGLGNVSSKAAFANKGDIKAVSGNAATEAEKIQGGAVETHRYPVGGQKANSKKTHGEEQESAKWSNLVTRLRGRKDELALVSNIVPEVFPDTLVAFSGFSPKVDGNWEVEEVQHSLVPGDAGSQTQVKCVRGTSSQAASQAAAVAFSYSGAKSK